jgi:DHA2 family multidrug resistance protein-like MFS transporter
MIVSAAPPERAGSASAILETCSEFCAALGIAVFGSLGNLIYRLGMSEHISGGKSGLPGVDDIANLGNTLATPETLPGVLKETVLSDARSVFVDSMHIAAFFAALLLVCASVLTDRILRAKASG